MGSLSTLPMNSYIARPSSSSYSESLRYLLQLQWGNRNHEKRILSSSLYHLENSRIHFYFEKISSYYKDDEFLRFFQRPFFPKSTLFHPRKDFSFLNIPSFYYVIKLIPINYFSQNSDKFLPLILDCCLVTYFSVPPYH